MVWARDFGLRRIKALAGGDKPPPLYQKNRYTVQGVVNAEVGMRNAEGNGIRYSARPGPDRLCDDLV